jgi:hypothetical protein
MRAAGARRSAPCGVNTSDGDRSLGTQREASLASAVCAEVPPGVEARMTKQTTTMILIALNPCPVEEILRLGWDVRNAAVDSRTLTTASGRGRVETHSGVGRTPSMMR